MPPTPKFSCSFCGKQYLWKDELAGRAISCSCGQVFRAPSSPEARWQDDLRAELARRSEPPAKAEPVRAERFQPAAPPAQNIAIAPPPEMIPHIQPARYEG